MIPTAQPMRAPLEFVVLFGDRVPENLGFDAAQVKASPLAEVPRLVGADSELALLLTPEERYAAAAARAALLLRFEDEGAPTAARLSAGVDHILRCHELGAVAVVLPAARRVIGPSKLADLAPALSGTQGWMHLFVQFHVVQRDEEAWSHTHGMAHYRLPDLECRTTLADRALALRLLEAGVAHLLEHGADGLEPGKLVEATEADGRFLARFRVHAARAVEGHAYDAWGALQLVPITEGTPQPDTPEEDSMDVRSQLKLFITNKQRARDLDLQGAELAGTDLSGLSADRLDLSGADLHGATLRSARLGGCRLHAAQLEQTEWSSATLRTCALDGANVAGARFDDARIEDSSVKGADLTRASLRRAKLTETSFERSILREAALDDATGDGVELRGADLSGATLLGARLDGADFRGADLRGADLSRGRFRGADFRGALLEGARLEGADFEGARFDSGERPRDDAATRTRSGSAAELDRVALAALRDGLASLSGAFAARGTAPGELPEELKRWLEPLAKIAEAAPAGAFFDQLQRALDKAGSGSDEPPEELKPLLEPLMAMLNEGRALDPKAFLDALSSFAQRWPTRPGGPASSE